MQWQYRLSTGELSREGVVVTTGGFSGNGPGRNLPGFGHAPSLGSVPPGSYRLVPTADLARIDLLPHGHTADARRGLHLTLADPAARLQAPAGAIVLPPLALPAVRNGGLRFLDVVA